MLASRDRERETLTPEMVTIVRRTVYRLTAGRGVCVEDWEDIEVAAELGAVRAARTWAPEKGAAWRSWLITCVRAAVWTQLREQDPLTRGDRARVRAGEMRPEWAPPLSLETVLADEGENENAPRTVTGCLAGNEEERPEVALLRRERDRILWAAVAALPERERDLIVWHYRDGVTFAVIGTRHGVGESRTQQRHWRALERLWEMLTDEGGEGDA